MCWVLAVLTTVLVGISRIYLGVHWPSYVLAGWCAGFAWAMLCWLAPGAWQRWRGQTNGGCMTNQRSYMYDDA